LATLPIARLANSDAQRWVRSHRGALPRSLGDAASGSRGHAVRALRNCSNPAQRRWVRRYGVGVVS
jgi:hypothetical protein